MYPNLASLNKIKILLLENISESAVTEFKNAGLNNLTVLKHSPSNEELKEIGHEYHVIGIRSRTKITASALKELPKLSVIGCFCIGTNQVDLKAAKKLGLPVFNAPYSNTRSVAELAICEIIALFRQIPTKTAQMHQGIWDKSATDCFEIRGKTLGIVGYGHIGKQLSTLAESLGMKVFYFDTIPQLSLGNAIPVNSLNKLLSISDVVSLHVPENSTTQNLISAREIEFMRKKSFLINLSRGSVVDLKALAKALHKKHLAGAALDVFPVEPSLAGQNFDNIFKDLDNVILTPHIAGSTEEAQKNIGQEVAAKISNFLITGSTINTVNFVEVNIAKPVDRTRFIHIHKNISGMLAKINDLFGNMRINILSQALQTDSDIGYALIDTEVLTPKHRDQVKEALRKIPQTIRAYAIY